MVRTRRLGGLVAFGLGMVVLGGPALAQDDARGFAQQLSTLRTEVASLTETLDLEREALRADLRNLELRKAELEARIRQEELRLQELERTVERQREVLDADTLADEHLVPMIEASVDDLVAAVRAGLPYRVEDRVEALESLRDKVREGTLDPRRAVGRLWQAVEDELRLGRENIRDRQALPLPQGQVLVDVARLGMISLFYRTEAGAYGMAVRQGDGWAFEPLGEEHAVRLDELFDALEKQIRVGYFELPWALPEVAR